MEKKRKCNKNRNQWYIFENSNRQMLKTKKNNGFKLGYFIFDITMSII